MKTVLFGRRSSGRRRTVWIILIGCVFLASCPPLDRAQAPASTSQTPQSGTPQDATKPAASSTKNEIVSHDVPATFKVRVNLVLVRVVVRDGNGKVVSNLKREDFQLADNRKLQVISSFSVETPASQVTTAKTDSPESTTEGAPVKAPVLPQRFIALYFDDLHLSTSDAMVSRQAATKLFNVMQPADRFAISSTSGQVQQDFTADRERLDDAIKRIVPRLSSQSSPSDCPPMTFYEAYKILDVHDPTAVTVAVQDVLQCIPIADSTSARIIAESAAQRELDFEESQLQVTYQNLEVLIRRMSALPGQRIIAMMSPGFFVTPVMHWSGEIIDRAAKANIVLNTIDARGLYVSSVYDASNDAPESPIKTQFMLEEERIRDEVLGELADGTGGLFIHNRNDIDQGLLQAVAEPEVSYLLGFTPQNLKLNGEYHNLKVTLTGKQKWALQARHGYFAPKGESNPEATAREEIQQAVFSQEELHELPVECQTQFFKGADGVHLSVVAHLETKELKFHKADDRNADKLTITTAVFDENGNMLKGQQRVIEMQLKDATLERVNKTGLTVRSSFDLQPGKFLVRVVVRDSEGAQMGATNRGVVIP